MSSKSIKKEFKFVSAGFEEPNPNAEVIIVGITPGRSQLKDKPTGMTALEIKKRNAFKGAIRSNLVSLFELCWCQQIARNFFL